MIKVIDAVEFEATCLELLDEVERTGLRVVVTKDGQPLVELRPHEPDSTLARTSTKT